jgi:putative FmdB family regulatory protein
MPIYEYECTNCGHYFDLIQKSDAPSEQECPECLKNTAKRLVSAPGFQLKGSGWYQTDFKNKGVSTSKKEETANSDKKSEKKTTEEKAPSTAVKDKTEKT